MGRSHKNNSLAADGGDHGGEGGDRTAMKGQNHRSSRLALAVMLTTLVLSLTYIPLDATSAIMRRALAPVLGVRVSSDDVALSRGRAMMRFSALGAGGDLSPEGAGAAMQLAGLGGGILSPEEMRTLGHVAGHDGIAAGAAHTTGDQALALHGQPQDAAHRARGLPRGEAQSKVDTWPGDQEPLQLNFDVTTVPAHKQLSKTWVAQHKLYVARAQSKKIPIDALILGDVIAQNWHKPGTWGGSEALHALGKRVNASLLSLGIAGDFTARLRWRVRHGEVPKDVKVIILNTGYIDAAYGGRDAAAVAKDVIELASEIQVHRPSARVIIQGILPEAKVRDPKAVDKNAVDVNAAIKQSLPKNLEFKDCAPYFMNVEKGELYGIKYAREAKRYHLLNSKGYADLASCLEGVLTRLVK